MDFTLSTMGTTNKWFVEFGGNYTWNGNGPQSVVSRHFYIKMPSGKPVYSMIDGVVRSASLNDNHPDYEVRLSPRTGSYWVVGYDHLENITVAAGDTVVAGQQIGVTSTVNTADLEVDISLNGDPSTYFCLSDFFDPSVSTSLRTKLAQLMTDIETVKGDASLYNQAGHHNTACVLESFQSE